jgi:hypothetical protein
MGQLLLHILFQWQVTIKSSLPFVLGKIAAATRMFALGGPDCCLNPLFAGASPIAACL